MSLSVAIGPSYPIHVATSKVVINRVSAKMELTPEERTICWSTGVSEAEYTAAREKWEAREAKNRDANLKVAEQGTEEERAAEKAKLEAEEAKKRRQHEHDGVTNTAEEQCSMFAGGVQVGVKFATYC